MAKWVIMAVCERCDDDPIPVIFFDDIPAEAMDCPRCGKPVDLYIMTEQAHMDNVHRRQAWAEANESAMEACDGSWDY